LILGPTREAIDPVRFLSNYSSGKMGYALAIAAAMAGAEVTLISGPSVLGVPAGITLIRVESAQEMYDAVLNLKQKEYIFIGTAAVADYGIEKPALEKVKKKDHEELTLHLSKNKDILATVASSGKAAFVVGFAAETNNVRSGNQ